MLRAILLSLIPLPALACGAPICRVEPGVQELTEIIDFDDLPSAWDPGHRIDTELRLPGASFAERFAGQRLGADGVFDTVTGAPLQPLTLLPGAPGQTLSVVNMMGSNILNGFGPAGFPRVQAQGEGAIAVMFDFDQSGFSFDLLGGEDGRARIQFIARDGRIIHETGYDVSGPVTLEFRRAGFEIDIAGFVLTNMDPQGIAIDNLRFGPPPNLG